jgi:hypothetical protein
MDRVGIYVMLRNACVAAAMLLATGQVMAVSVWELSRVCGEDTEKWCQGVAYGDAMQECIDANYSKLTKECAEIADRIRNGEKVSLF